MSEEKKHKLRKNKVVTDNYLNFLFELWSVGEHLVSQEDVDLLKETGYITVSTVQSNETLPEFEEINEYTTSSKTSVQVSIDSKVDIVNEADDDGSYLKIISDEDLKDRIKNGGYIFNGRTEEISVSEWMPESTTDHTKEFIDWVTSITILGFSKRKNFSKLNLYVQQAYSWLSDGKTVSDFDEEHEQEDYMLSEIQRCRDNTLYFANKYGWYKDGDVENGEARYVASPAHEIMFYLNDAGYSQAITKGRQMAATTTQMLCDLKDVVFKRNYFMKFVTEDKEKAQEIFEDKLKFPFSKLPQWMRPDVINDRENFFKLGSKEEKGDRDGVNSSIRVVAPKVTVIAGGAPNKAKIDEAGNIDILSKMIEDQRPTMYWHDPKTKKVKIKRQLIFWGTGGELEKGGKAFETEFMAIWNSWLEGKFDSCIVPIFFDWTARPGVSQSDYDREKSVAYSKVGPDAKKSIVTFHQQWPTSLSDVFKTTGKTLVDEEFIKENKNRITDAMVKTNHQLVKRGYFEPIYDETKPNDEHSHLPYKVIDANFIPTDDFDPRGVVTMFMEPDRKFINRYYEGTDPIMSDSGISDMASAIWDRWLKTISCIVNFRSNDPRDTYLQSMLLGVYYGTGHIKKASKQLLESNIGPPYKDYVVTSGFEDCLTLNYELPIYLQNHSTKNEGVGIDNKNPRTGMIISKLTELLKGFGDRLYIETIFTQVETFVCSVTAMGNETWGPSNKKYFRDDVLFACVYAYICGEYCYSELVPINVSSEKSNFKWVAELYHDKDWKLCKRMVKKPIHG